MLIIFRNFNKKYYLCYELNDANRKRELGGFAALQASVKSKTVITFNQKEQEDDIQMIPLWEWVLEN
ncbi:MAG: hypothetical protein J6C31_08345 [Prevotella sp.]|nr:hypothetical protein [Prevotella sp.]MBO5062604.1 hypothetical protein [Prevotella sp.]MDO5525097.1 hypothetical protein [Prevotella sp.]